jgi:hypothetical protein
MKYDINSIHCKGHVEYENKNDIIIRGVINDYVIDNILYYSAPCPPKYNGSFSGSGLPYFSREQAYENTPNKGSVVLDSEGNFVITLIKPNSYYSDFDNLNCPEIEIIYNKNKLFTVKLDHEKIAHRLLSYPELRKSEGVLFYARQMPIRSQERILLDSDYKKKESQDFWGLKPPN